MTRALVWVGLILIGLNIPVPAEANQAAELPLIDDIVIEGLNRTDRAVLIHELGLDVGDPFDENKFDDIWDHLEDCGYFVFVEMDYEETAPGEVTLYVTVEEERSFQIYPWVKYDLRFKYFLGLVLRDFNFRGKGETISFHGAYWYIQRYRAKWQRPRFLNVPNLETSLFGGWEKGGFVFLPTDFIWWDVGGWLRWYPVSPLSWKVVSPTARSSKVI